MEEPSARVTVKLVLPTSMLSIAALAPVTLMVMPFTESTTVSVVSVTSLYAAKVRPGRSSAVRAPESRSFFMGSHWFRADNQVLYQ